MSKIKNSKRDYVNESWQCVQLGEPNKLKICKTPVPDIADDEILIETKSFAVGFPDLLMVQGKYQLKPHLPFTPCTELSGVVVRGGRKTIFSTGQNVIANVRYGAASRFVAAKGDDCLALPSQLTFREGAAFLIANKTAYVGLISRGALTAKDSVLVAGASGGVGLAALNLARRTGAKVVALVSTKEKLDFLEKRGFENVFLSGRDDLIDKVKEVCDGKGADVIFDPVGGSLFKSLLRCSAPLGRILIVGFADGLIPTVSTNYPLIKQLSIIGVRAGEYGRQNPSENSKVMTDLGRLSKDRMMQPYVHKEFDWLEIADAFNLISERSVVGRVVISF